MNPPAHDCNLLWTVPCYLIAPSGFSVVPGGCAQPKAVPLQVLVGGSALAKWHLPVSVVPGEADAKHCSIKARATAGATAHSPVVGQALSCILTTADAHGNLRHSGGASVSPVVIRPDGEETSKAKVLPIAL